MNEYVLGKITFIFPLHAWEEPTTEEKTDNVSKFPQQNINIKLKWGSKLKKVSHCFIFRIFFLKKYTNSKKRITLGVEEMVLTVFAVCAHFLTRVHGWGNKRASLPV